MIAEQGNENIVLDFINKDNSSVDCSFTGKYNYNSTNFENYLFSRVIDKTGEYSISLKIANNFGLIGYYYQNVDLHNLFSQKDLKYHPSLYSKYYTRIDEKIDFSLSYYSFMNNYPSKLISVIWEGFLKPDSSETYTITLEDQSRIIVYIDNKLVISYCSTKNSKTSSFATENYVNIALDRSIYTHIKILYIKEEDVLKQIIPKYHYIVFYIIMK